MTGAVITMTLDISGWEAELRARMAAVSDHSGFLAQTGESLLILVTDHFKSETAPDGQKWVRLSPVTVGQRLKKFGNAPITILRARGTLRGSIAKEVDGNMLKIGTIGGSDAEAYAAIHQFGGQAGRGHKVTIPARPYLGFSDADLTLIEEEAADWYFGH